MTVTRLLAAALAAASAATVGNSNRSRRRQPADRPANRDHDRARTPAPRPRPGWSTSPSAATTSGRRSSRPRPTGSPLFSIAGRGPPVRHAGRHHRAPSAATRSPSLKDIPAGEYWMQPFVNVYTRFARADGKTVWLHMDQWEGQNWKRSPGNIYGEPVRVQFDPRSRPPDPPRRGQGDSADSAAGRHRARQAHQDREHRSCRSGGDIPSTSARRSCCRRTTTSIPTSAIR